MKTTNEIKKLEYGMKILFPCSPISIVSPMMGIALTSSDTPKEKIPMIISKYWEKDTDPNRYKVKLVPEKDDDKIRFGNENLYSSDLMSLIRKNVCSLIIND